MTWTVIGFVRVSNHIITERHSVDVTMVIRLQKLTDDVTADCSPHFVTTDGKSTGFVDDDDDDDDKDGDDDGDDDDDGDGGGTPLCCDRG